MAEIKQRFTGDANQLEKEIERLKKAYEGLADKQARLQQQSKQSQDTALTMAQRMQAATEHGVISVRNWAMQYIGLQQAIQLATNAIREQHRVAEESRRTNLDVGQSQAAVLKNIGRTTDEENQAFFARISEIQKDSQFGSVAPLNTAAASILSATGSDRDRTLQILESAAPFFRDSQHELATFGGVLGDMMKAMGGKGSSKEALSMALAIQGQARFEKLGGFKNVAPSLAAVVNTVDTDRVEATRQAGALFAGIGNVSGDVEGAITKTSMSKLAVSLRETLRGAGQDTSGMSLFAMLEAVRDDKKLQQDMMSKGFESQMRPVIESLITSRDSDVSRQVAAAYAEIRSDEAFVDEKRRQLTTGTKELRVTTSEAMSQAGVQAYELEDENSVDAQARSIMNKVLNKAAGEGYVQSMFNRGGFETQAMIHGDTLATVRELVSARDNAMDPAYQRFVQSQLEALAPLLESSENFKKAAAELSRANQRWNARGQGRSQEERE